MSKTNHSPNGSSLKELSGLLLSSDNSTLTKCLSDEMRKTKTSSDELCTLFACIQRIAKSISAALRVGVCKMYGCTLPGHSHEDLKEINEMTNNIFIESLRTSYTTCLLVSHATQGLIKVDVEKRGKYVVCFNPLDETNIDSYSCVGSTFAIFKRITGGEPQMEDVLQPGRNLVAAGYILYGSATIMVVSIGQGVHSFTLNPIIGEFVLTDRNMQIPARGNTYSVNEGYMYQWTQSIAEYVESKKGYKSGQPYDIRYTGSVTGDMHRTLRDGGIVMHPTTSKNPKGELSLLYECIPLAYIATQAGGLASDGTMPILDIIPEGLYQKSQIYLGSRDDVRDILAVIKKNTRAERERGSI